MMNEQPTQSVLEMPLPPLIFGDWQAVARRYEHELALLRPIVDGITNGTQGHLYCPMCWALMPARGRVESEGRDMSRGHKSECVYGLWRNAQKEEVEMNNTWVKLEEAQQAYDAMPHYEDDTGCWYCADCHSLLAGGPHSPNPHKNYCEWFSLWSACKEANDAIPDGSEEDGGDDNS